MRCSTLRKSSDRSFKKSCCSVWQSYLRTSSQTFGVVNTSQAHIRKATYPTTRAKGLIALSLDAVASKSAWFDSRSFCFFTLVPHPFPKEEEDFGFKCFRCARLAAYMCSMVLLQGSRRRLSMLVPCSLRRPHRKRRLHTFLSEAFCS